MYKRLFKVFNARDRKNALRRVRSIRKQLAKDGATVTEEALEKGNMREKRIVVTKTEFRISENLSNWLHGTQ